MKLKTTDNPVRIVHISDIIDLRLLDQNTTKLAVLDTIYETTKSKIGTNSILEGKSNFAVINSEPQKNDQYFAVALIPLHKIQVNFSGLQKVEHFNKGTRVFYLKPGDLLIYSNTDYENILTDDGGDAYQHYHFRIVKYAIREKLPYGSGPNKYKASITFSDTYELEIFANNEKEALELSKEIPFYDWDHLYDIDNDKYKDYLTQPIRHSVWLPEKIIITGVEE